jgi:hypothetical protein
MKPRGLPGDLLGELLMERERRGADGQCRRPKRCSAHPSRRGISAGSRRRRWPGSARRLAPRGRETRHDCQSHRRRPSRSGPTRDASTIAARWSPQRCPTRLSKIGPSTASSRMQRDSNPRSPVIGTTVAEAIPFAHPGTSPCGSLCTRKWRPLLIPGSPQCDRRWPPAGAGNSPLFVVRRPLGANVVAEIASNAHIFGNVSLGSGQSPIMAR